MENSAALRGQFALRTVKVCEAAEAELTQTFAQKFAHKMQKGCAEFHKLPPGLNHTHVVFLAPLLRLRFAALPHRTEAF